MVTNSHAASSNDIPGRAPHLPQCCRWDASAFGVIFDSRACQEQYVAPASQLMSRRPLPTVTEGSRIGPCAQRRAQRAHTC